MTASASPWAPGRLLVFLGAAAGVGKTYAMLGEAQAALADGVDVVIGHLEPHERPATAGRARGLPRVPSRMVGTRERVGAEVDVEAIIARRPTVAVVDELAHAYSVGDPPRRRHEDVAELLRAGIEVWTTLNIQHIEGLNDRVREVAGVTVSETLPDEWVHRADEVRLIDLAPAALRERVARGLVYPPERAEAALAGFFTLERLTALRALALEELAERAAADLDALAGPGAPRLVPRVLVAVGGDPGDRRRVREALRLARRLAGEAVVIDCIGATVAGDRAHRHVEVVRALIVRAGAAVVARPGAEPAAALAEEVPVQDATHAVIEAPPGGGLRAPWVDRELGRQVRSLGDVVTVVLPARR